MNVADRVKETTTVTSAATIILDGAVAKFQAFAAAFAVGTAKIPVGTDDLNGNWENSEYTLTNANTLTRTAIHSSSNGGAPVTFPAGVKEVSCTLTAVAFNAALADAAASASSGVRDIAFALSVPLNVAGDAYMPQQSVSSVLAFTPAASAVRGALVYLRLIADGTNAPTFNGFKEWGGSMGYDNRNGIANQVQFFHDGVDSWYSISQAVNAQAQPSPATAVTLTGPTGGVVNAASTAFTVGTNGTRSGSVTVTPTPVTGVTFSPTSVTLAAGTGTATFTATPTTTGAKSIAVTNDGGLSNPAAITYTVTAAATVPDAPTIGVLTGGDGTVSQAFSAPTNNGGATITGYTLTIYRVSDNGVVTTATGASSPLSATVANGTAVYGKVKASNSVGPGAESAASNTVTPVAPAPEVIRLVALDTLAESGTGPYSYNQTTSSGGFGTKGGLLNKKLASGTDGSFALRNVSGSQFMMCVPTSASPSAVETYTTCRYAFWTGASGSSYKIYEGGVVRTPVATVTQAANDIMRLRRSGTDLIAEVAREATPNTWTTIYTFANATGILAFEVNTLICTLDTLTGVNLA